MRIPLPSWVAAVVGASVVGWTTTLGVRPIERLTDDIEALSQAISDAKQQYDTDRLTHRQAENNGAYADLFFGNWKTCLMLAKLADTPAGCTILADRAAWYVGSATGLLAQTTAADYEETDYEATAKQVSRLETRLRGGDETAYEELTNIYGAWRLHSIRALQTDAAGIRGMERRHRQKRSERDSGRTFRLGVALWGLIILMLKDVPMWRRARSPAN